MSNLMRVAATVLAAAWIFVGGTGFAAAGGDDDPGMTHNGMPHDTPGMTHN